MSLAELIRKRDPVKPANDNPAKAANDGLIRGEPLAGLAALALANPPEAETVTPADCRIEKVIGNEARKVGTSDPAAKTSWGWLLHYSDHDPVEVYTSPESILDEMLRDFPGAIAAEPIHGAQA